MEILKILQENGEDLYPIDLDFFETELRTGDYDEDYINECNLLITAIRNWEPSSTSHDKEDNPEQDTPNSKTTGIAILDKSELLPENKNERSEDRFVREVLRNIDKMRNVSNYKSSFRKYLKECKYIDEDFVDKQFAFFHPWERSAIVSTMPLSEAFLERHMPSLDKEQISRHQTFSEAFFMKHIHELQVEIVLTQGKNAWRKKENRSSQLDVFLRLRGVKI